MLIFDYAIKSSVGNLRKDNQDSGYAGQNLILVADGMGGYKGGDTASQIAISHISKLDEEYPNSDVAVRSLKNTVQNAQNELVLATQKNKKLSGFGTTITALLKSDNSLILGHIGDSRAYILQKSKHNEYIFDQITKDHTYVQYLVDNGQLTPEQAYDHPKKSLLLRVLTDADFDQNIDISIRSANINDRYMLCSDGLSGLVKNETIKNVLISSKTPKQAVDILIDLALKAGGTDNITCIVADIVDYEKLKVEPDVEIVGAIANDDNMPNETLKKQKSFYKKKNNKDNKRYIPFLIQQNQKASLKKIKKQKIIARVSIIFVILAILLGGLIFDNWSKKQYYVGINNNYVAIYKGIKQRIGPIQLSNPIKTTTISDATLPEYIKMQLNSGIKVDNFDQANNTINNIIISKNTQNSD